MTPARLDGFAAAWTRCDLDELGDYLTNDAVFVPLDGRVARGRDEVVRRFAEVLASQGDCTVMFEPARVTGSIGTCQWSLEGQTAEGALFRISGIDLYEFDGDRIRLKDMYQKP